jgi:mRNA interferase MazF
MHPIHLVTLDKPRPAVILTRHEALDVLKRVTVAPITSTIRGIDIEVPVGRDHGLDHDSVINCDNVTSVPRAAIGPQLGLLSATDEIALLRALRKAFDLPFG